jgi:ABC-type branched-subunit amino acid transport system substrate-binding protein/DNA-binding beta-propeller fold protein YncE
MPTELTAGSTLAGYRIEGLVGRGGMGVVHRATDLRLERPVALKLITPELAGDERFRSRFLRESRLAASLDHPAVVPIYEAGDVDGRLFIAMRYVDGEDLKTLLERERTMAPERTVAILAQVGDALDAAHEKGLVHRDVKPANVLLDGRERPYLSDFGLTKQVAGASTQTGQLVGTLDYLAPEQIRGQTVDARTDQYSLACVLYECLAGRPPFRRQTEAEVLWAHMQEPPPSLRRYRELDTVFAKALAKERDERYGSCSEFLAAAADALGIEPPARRARRLRVGRRLLLVGAALLAGSIAALGAVLITGDDGELVAPGDAVAAIEHGGERVVSYTEVGTTPSNVVLGEGSVWVLNGDDRTISMIDPETRRIVQTFGTGRLPADLAVGEGAIWVGNGVITHGFQYLASVSRIDPDSRTETHTVELPGGDRALESVTSGVSRLAVGAGAVWAINPDNTVSRIDARTGELVAQVRGAKDAGAIAAGRGGIWFIGDGPSVVRIDARSNRVGQRIEVGASFLAGIAVGGGSVWVTAPDQGVVWRIEPGRPPLTRTIDVGFGVAHIAFGDDAVWTTNFLNGTVSRIDPRTNRVTATSTVAGTPQGLTADGRSTWVSVAGGTTPGTLQTSACGPVASGGRRPDVLIASDLPLQPPVGEQARPLADAVRHVLERHEFRAGAYTVGYQSCDVSTAQAGLSDFFKCGSNAKAYAQAVDLVAVIGTYHSGCAAIQIPILNRAAGGPLAMVSPANSKPGLTRRGPGSDRGEPEIYYPTGTRNFMRVTAIDPMQGAAGAVLAKQLGLRRVYLLAQRDQYGVFLGSGFRRAARALGLKIVGSGSWEVEARSFAGLVEPVARSGADGVFVAGVAFPGGENVVTALRTRLGRQVTLIGGDAFFDALEVAGREAVGMYVAFSGQPPGELGPAGRSFVRSFRRGRPEREIPPYVLEAAQATEVVLQAIARSDGTRASVLRELRALEIEDGILGSFRFDRNGDITPSPITIYRITGKTGPGSPLEGGVVDRVIRVPSRVFPGAG